MRRFILTGRYIFIFFLLNNISIFAGNKLEVKAPVCEYKSNPLGIDVQKPRLSWQIVSSDENVLQAAYEIRAAESLSDLDNKSKNIWSSGKVTSDNSVNIPYEGTVLKSLQKVYWQVRVWDNKNRVSDWSSPASWEMGILEPETWKASWITIKSESENLESKPCQYFRKDFNSSKKILSARAYVTSLGLYQLFLNGKKVGNDLFTPGWTSYNKRLQYQVYDITNRLNQGTNTVGIILGDGWYRGYLRWSSYKPNTYGTKLAALLQIQVTYADGSNELLIYTDSTWKAATGPLLSSDIYNGETYDARLELTGWALPGFNDKKWEQVSILDHSKKILVASQSDPVKAIQELKPVKIITTPKGEKVFDLGQNMVGWVRLKVTGEKGNVITLKFAEVLDKDGNFYTENLRKAKCTDVYILKGTGDEVYEPHFTFHGFRFVKIEGLTVPPTLDNITGIVIHTNMEPTGTFVCSDSLINQLQHNIQWGQKGNFLDIPTDCPQRDERFGWTGDAQVFSMTAAFNFNTATFYTKWLKDLAADQTSNGKVPHVIPDVSLKGDGGSTAWADASVIVPWTIYLTYGDKRILEMQYPSMKAWVEYILNCAGDDFLWTGSSHFGDWLYFVGSNPTDNDVIANAYSIYSIGLLSKTASIIGQPQDAEKYAELSKKFKSAFLKEFVTPAGRIISHNQTVYSLALAFNILPKDLVPTAVSYLAADVKKYGHLTTGFVGTPILCKSLSTNGQDSLAFMLLNRKKYPSWLYPITQGATTIWERWDGQKPDGTFQDIGMNSFNHYAYGAIGEWLYQYVAGLNIDEQKPGYKHIILSPHVGGGLKNAKVEFNSLYGKIVSSWKLENNSFVYEVNIPTNTTATVTLPNIQIEGLKINSKPVTAKTTINVSGNNASLTLGSGKYLFTYPYGK
jgi:alpha-L-rhamnosidase